MRRHMDRWWLVVLEGVAGIVLGVLEIAVAVRMRKLIENEWLLIASGIASVIFGALLIVFPSAGALSLVWLIGFYSLIFGILMLLFSFRLRGTRDSLGGRAAHPA